MRNVFHIFASEFKLLGSNVMTLLIVLGLVLVPSLFTWYNVLACWNVFDNTGNLKVAVANADKGYTSDLFPMPVNVGEEVISALRENEDIDWIFVDEEQAIDGAASGAYYAAIVIPEDFSESMLTFYQDDVSLTELVYYTNNKKNAIAPRITGKGADSVSYQVNESFAETTSELLLTIAKSMDGYLDKADASSKLARLSSTIDHVGSRLDEAGSVLRLYGTLSGTASRLLDSTSSLLGKVRESGSEVASISRGAMDDASVTTNELKGALDDMSKALDASIEAVEVIANGKIDGLDASSEEAAAKLRERKASVDAQIESYEALLEEFKQNPDADPEAIKNLETAIEDLKALSVELGESADKIENGAAADVADEVRKQAGKTAASLRALKSAYEKNLSVSLGKMASEVAALSASVDRLAGNLDKATGSLAAASSSAGDELGGLSGKLSSMASKMSASASKLHALSSDVDQALASNDMQRVRDLLSSDVEGMAHSLAAPVSMERNAVFPSENFGSSMLPLYLALAMVIGALLIMVLFKPSTSQRVLEEFGEEQPTVRQQFLGHFGIVGVISLAQTTVLGVGCILFLGAQVQYPLLFMLAVWVSGLTFTFIMYFLVASFANIGKAVGVLLLVLQVTGCGGSYPLPILPDFVQSVSAFLPAYHMVNALRAAQFGLYANDFWIELGIIVLFTVPLFVVALLLRKPLDKFMKWFVKRSQDTKLLS